MIVINNFEANRSYPEETLRYCHWERFNNSAIDCYFFNAHPLGLFDAREFNYPKIVLYFEEQLNEENRNDSLAIYADKWLTILNPEVSGRNGNRQSVFYPTNEEVIKNINYSDKKYDVIYTGNINRGPHTDIISNTIKDFNYRLFSFERNHLVTNSGGSYLEKLQMVADTKISVCHGLVGDGTPQTKSRYFEAAFCKSLILMYRDNWNLIEEWFTPNIDFIYWNNESELRDLVIDASNNYEKYLPIIENAYNKAINNYTTINFIEKYVGFKE
jgi:hypothetical protein